MKLLKSNLLIKSKRAELITEFSTMRSKPTLVVILVGDNPASMRYTSIKQSQAKDYGVKFKLIQYPEDIKEKELFYNISKFNQDKSVTGIIVQLPLPQHIDTQKVIWSIDASKDVDGFRYQLLMPPTPSGIIELLKYYHISISERKILIIGRGILVGKPLSLMLTKMNARVELVGRDEQDLISKISRAEIVVCATGQPNLITADMVNKNQIIIDAGSADVGGKAVSDVDFENVKHKVSAITPPVGGVGPMTVLMLFSNLAAAWKIQLEFKNNEKK